MDYTDELKEAIHREAFSEALDILQSHLFSRRELMDVAIEYRESENLRAYAFFSQINNAQKNYQSEDLGDAADFGELLSMLITGETKILDEWKKVEVAPEKLMIFSQLLTAPDEENQEALGAMLGSLSSPTDLVLIFQKLAAGFAESDQKEALQKLKLLSEQLFGVEEPALEKILRVVCQFLMMDDSSLVRVPEIDEKLVNLAVIQKIQELLVVSSDYCTEPLAQLVSQLKEDQAVPSLIKLAANMKDNKKALGYLLIGLEDMYGVHNEAAEDEMEEEEDSPSRLLQHQMLAAVQKQDAAQIQKIAKELQPEQIVEVIEALREQNQEAFTYLDSVLNGKTSKKSWLKRTAGAVASGFAAIYRKLFRKQ